MKPLHHVLFAEVIVYTHFAKRSIEAFPGTASIELRETLEMEVVAAPVYPDAHSCPCPCNGIHQAHCQPHVCQRDVVYSLSDHVDQGIHPKVVHWPVQHHTFLDLDRTPPPHPVITRVVPISTTWKRRKQAWCFSIGSIVRSVGWMLRCPTPGQRYSWIVVRRDAIHLDMSHRSLRPFCN